MNSMWLKRPNLSNAVLVVIIFLHNVSLKFASNPTYFPCKNSISSYEYFKRCDNIRDCPDGSDELNCESAAMLLVNNDIHLEGKFLDTGEEFRATIRAFEFGFCTSYFITFRAAETHSFYAICLERIDKSRVSHVKKDGSIITASTLSGLVKNLVIDDVTSNVYLVRDLQINLCDQSAEFCTPLRELTDEYKNPNHLAFYAEEGALFWIDQNQKSNKSILRADRDGSGFKRISKDLEDAKHLTVDYLEKRLYWIDQLNGTDCIYSSSLDGSDQKMVVLIENRRTKSIKLTVYKDDLYWLDLWNWMPRTCNKNHCVPTLEIIKSKWNNYTLDSMVLDDYSRKSRVSQLENPCRHSHCSHLCVFVPPTSSKSVCICGSQFPLDVNGFCKGATLLAVYENNLLILGLSGEGPEITLPSQFIRKIIFQNINSIATIAYTSRFGTLILTATEKQRIYSWNTEIGEAKLLLDEGDGTIVSIEIDDSDDQTAYLYWINPTNYQVKKMSLKYANESISIIQGNSSSVPLSLTLNPEMRYMYVLFQENSGIKLKRISMDYHAENTNRTMTSDMYKFVDSITPNSSLHYQRQTKELYLLDKSNNQIRRWNEKIREFEFLDFTKSGSLISIGFVNSAIFWSEDDLQIYGPNSYSISAKKLGLNETLQTTLKLVGVSEDSK